MDVLQLHISWYVQDTKPYHPNVLVTTQLVAQVNCLADFFPEEALERARELDTILAKTGKPVGPLHGLPVGVKVRLFLALC